MWFDKNSRLRKAIKRGSLTDVASLIDAGANVNSKCFWDHQPLTLATRLGYLDILNLLLSKGANVNTGIPLEYAETREIAATLIDAGVDQYSQNSALVSAAIRTLSQDNEKLEMLLDAGVNVDAINIEGETPLIFLAHTICPQKLPNTLEAQMVTKSLNRLFENRTNKVMMFLIEHGADVNAQSHNGHTALIWSAFRNTRIIAATLLQAGANPMLRNSAEATALCLALSKGHTEMAGRLFAEEVIRAHDANNLTLSKNSEKCTIEFSTVHSELLRHCGSECYKDFITELYYKYMNKGRLKYWQEQLWQEFSNANNINEPAQLVRVIQALNLPGISI